MRKSSTVSAKGQTTLPKEIRDYLQLGPRQRVSFVVEEGKVVLRPEGRPLSALAGSLRGKAPAPAKGQARKIVVDAAVARFRKASR
jgi:AbrB family looped-hinge helix DNA binding protein